jgi:hypothetical protein
MSEINHTSNPLDADQPSQAPRVVSINDNNTNSNGPNRRQDPSQNARKSGGFSLHWDFDADPEYQDTLKRYAEALQPEGRPQGHAVANMVKAVIMMDRVLLGGHAPDSAARLYSTFSRSYLKSYDLFRKLRDDQGPRLRKIVVKIVTPWDTEAEAEERERRRKERCREADLSDGLPIDPARTHPYLDIPLSPTDPDLIPDPKAARGPDPEPDPEPEPDPSPAPALPAAPAGDESHSGEPAPASHKPARRPAKPRGKRLPGPVAHALQQAIDSGFFENCENGIFPLPGCPGYQVEIEVEGVETVQPAPETAPPASPLVRHAAF